jgi:hypothetical protein
MAAAMMVTSVEGAEDGSQLGAPGAGSSQAAADTSAIILAPKTPTVPARAPGVASASIPPTGVAADIATSLPKFKQEPAATPLSEQPDMRDLDKPRNKIPRLPAGMMSTYIVHADRVPVFRERDLYTKKGLIDLAMKNHPGLRLGNFFGLNSGAAYEAFLEDERIEKIHDLDDMALAFAVGNDPAEAKMILDQTGDAFIRDVDPSGPIHMGSQP